MRVIIKLLKSVSVPIAVLLLVLIFFSVTESFSEDRSKHDKENFERALNRAAVACYAIEGAYPPSVEYLIENYRIRVNTAKYAVKYELYASNLMPSITVLEISEEQ